MISSASPFLMFTGRCEEALTFYTQAMPGTRLVSLDRNDDGTVAMSRLDIAGLQIMANDSPPIHDFSFTPSTSIFLTADTPDSVSGLAEKLGEGGKTLMPPDNYGFSLCFAWVQDQFGVSWQINAA